MATLDELDKRGDLSKVEMPRIVMRHQERRDLYVLPEVEKWMRDGLKELTPFDPTDISPMQQAFALFKMFITGEALAEGTEFRLMQPLESDVYELKTPDLRFFGWFYKPGIFIVAAADTMEKVHSVNGLSSAYRDVVSKARDVLDLDPPKYEKGASISHVFSV